MDTDRLIVERDRGAKAKDILDSPIFQEAMDGLRSLYMQQWRSSDPSDMEGRENVYQMMNAIDLLEDHLVNVLNTGDMATVQLEDLKTRKHIM